MPTEYEKAHEAYRKTTPLSQDRIKAMNEIRHIERQAAREGTILSATYKGEQIVTQQRSAPSKRSLQEEYCRKFKDDAVVNVGGKDQTLRQYHTKRLLGK